MRSGTRWKSRVAAEAAVAEPMSGLYQQMQTWKPLEALLANPSVVLSVEANQAQGSEVLSVEEVWKSMQSSKREFVQLYKAYAHFRAKQWVVRSGLQYGADFMAYCHHPALVHSDYAVVVMAEGQLQRLNTWTEVQAMSRLSGSVAKTLLLLHVIPERDGIDTSTPECLGDFAVEAVEVQRWLPEKHRGESGDLVAQHQERGREAEEARPGHGAPF